MTEKLYENNSLLKSCAATVTACTEKDGKFLVELDKTVFFPEGGGQLSDKGTIGEAKVSHVSEQDGHIYHECDKALTVGSVVTATLDWPVRLDRMQQHLGEHLLSYACFKLFGANNIGFHMNEDMVTIDLDKELTAEELQQAELFTNEIIWDNRPVSVSYMDSVEAAKLPMRKFNHKLTGTLRIVAVEGADMCTCCGTHPPFTGMLGSVKVLKQEKHKQGVRVEFVCGRRALADADAKNNALLAAGAELSSKPEEVPERILKLKEDMAALYDELKAKTAALLDIKLNEAAKAAPSRTDGVKVLSLDVADAKEAKLMLTAATTLPNAVSLILTVQPDRISYVAVLGQNAAGDCRAYVKLLNEAFGGRGGGKSDCAQGGAPYCGDWQKKLSAVQAEVLKA